MINVNDLRNGTFFREGNEIFQVLTYEHIKMGRGSGNVKVKVKNLKRGSIVEKSFITGARVEEANVEKKKAQYLYKEEGSFNFMDPFTFEQFLLNQSVLGDNAKFLLDGMEVILLVFEDEAIGLELPNSLVYTIKDTGPSEKGNTVSNVYKEAVLENGLLVKVPMFMKPGEKVKIDTRTGGYMERVK